MKQHLYVKDGMFIMAYPTTRRNVSTDKKNELISKHPYCVYCGKYTNDLVLDHIYPLAKEGSNDISNLTVSCPSCNSRKGSYPIEDFLGITIEKRDKLYLEIRRHVYNLKMVRKGTPVHYMHYEDRLVRYIREGKSHFSLLTKIISSILNEKYKIF